MDKKGHWYTDKNGKHYFVEDGQTPKEGWEQSNRRKMINNGKYVVDEGDGSDPREVSKEEYDGYEADESEFDETIDDDFGFDEENNGSAEKQDERKLFLKEKGYLMREKRCMRMPPATPTFKESMLAIGIFTLILVSLRRVWLTPLPSLPSNKQSLPSGRAKSVRETALCKEVPTTK